MLHIWSPQNFARAPTEMLSLHVQNLMVIWYFNISKHIFIKFENKIIFVKQAPVSLNSYCFVPDDAKWTNLIMKSW